MTTLDAIVAELHERPLPSGWRRVRLGAVAAIVNGTTPASANPGYWGGDIVWVTPVDLGKLEQPEIKGSDRKITVEGLRSSNLTIVSPGTVVMSSRAPIGHLGIAEVELCTNQGCKSFVPGRDVDSYFLYYALKRSIWQFQQIGSGATFAEVSKAQCESFEIPLPPLAEQRRIAGILREQMAAVEQARAAVQARLEAVKALPAASMRRYLEEGESQQWPAVALGCVCTIDARQIDPKLPEYRDLPHVNGENIESGTGRLYGIKSAAEDRMTSGKYVFDAGVVLYSKLRPYLRKVALADFRGLCSADMYPLSFDPSRVDRRFALWTLLAIPFTNYAIGESQRARMPKLNRDQLFAWPFPAPSIQRQRQIAMLLSEQIEAADSARATVEGELNAINALPAALLRRAFSGEL